MRYLRRCVTYDDALPTTMRYLQNGTIAIATSFFLAVFTLSWYVTILAQTVVLIFPTALPPPKVQGGASFVT